MSGALTRVDEITLYYPAQIKKYKERMPYRIRISSN